MSDKRISREGKASGYGGLGGGVGLIAISHHLPPNLQWLEPPLEYASPFATLVITIVWAFVLSNYKRKRIKQSLTEAAALRDAVWSNPASSQSAKKDAQDAFDKIVKIATRLLVSDAEELAGFGDFSHIENTMHTSHRGDSAHASIDLSHVEKVETNRVKSA